MLAQLVSHLPTGTAWRYEPKLDRFRGLLEHAADRRVRLTSRNLAVLVDGLHPCLKLVMQPADPDLANDWLARVPAVEGIVAKRADGRYRSGRRDWIKIKRQRTVDCVVIGVAGDDHAPTLVL